MMQDQLICWVSKARFPLHHFARRQRNISTMTSFFSCSCRPTKTARNYVIGEHFSSGERNGQVENGLKALSHQRLDTSPNHAQTNYGKLGFSYSEQQQSAEQPIPTHTKQCLLCGLSKLIFAAIIPLVNKLANYTRHP